MKDLVRQAIAERLSVLAALAGRLEKIVAEGDAPGMLLCRLAVDADRAASELADHAAKLESGREGGR